MDTDTTPRLPNGTNVRFAKSTTKRVERIARKHRLKKADIIRNAVELALDDWERNGVKLHVISNEI